MKRWFIFFGLVMGFHANATLLTFDAAPAERFTTLHTQGYEH